MNDDPDVQHVYIEPGPITELAATGVGCGLGVVGAAVAGLVITVLVMAMLEAIFPNSGRVHINNKHRVQEAARHCPAAKEAIAHRVPRIWCPECSGRGFLTAEQNRLAYEKGQLHPVSDAEYQAGPLFDEKACPYLCPVCGTSGWLSLAYDISHPE